MPIRDIIVLGIIFGSVPYVLRKPWLGIILWCWISYMNPHRLCWYFAYNFPVAEIAAGAFFLGFFLSKDKHALPRSKIIGVWLLFILWMNVTTPFALNPESAFNEWDRCMKIQLMTFCTMLVITSPYRIKMLVSIIAASIAFFGVKGGIFALRTGLEWQVVGPPNSFIAANNEIGFALCMVLPMLRFLQLQMTKPWHRHAMTVAMLLCFTSILTTYSRGAFLTIIMMGAFLAWKSRQRSYLILVAVLAVPLIVTMLPQKWSDRMATIQTYEEDGSAMGRINAWWFAWNLAKDRPITGGGYNTFTPALFHKYAPNPIGFHDAHSIYFEVLGEHGFPGLFLFLTLFLSSYWLAGSVVRQTNGLAELRWANDLCRMLQVSLVAYAVGGLFLGLAYFDLPYHFIALVLVTHQVVAQELRAKAADIARPIGVLQG